MLTRLPQFGQKSIGRKLHIIDRNNINKFSLVLVQANKNHSIVNIVLVKNGVHTKLSDITSTFQGRQADDDFVIEHLIDVLNEKLN